MVLEEDPSTPSISHISRSPPSGPQVLTRTSPESTKKLDDFVPRKLFHDDVVASPAKFAPAGTIRFTFGKDLKIMVIGVIIFLIMAVIFYFSFLQERVGRPHSVFKFKNLPEATYLGGFKNPLSSFDFIWNEPRYQQESITSESEYELQILKASEEHLNQFNN
jgi:hypothetical protein